MPRPWDSTQPQPGSVAEERDLLIPTSMTVNSMPSKKRSLWERALNFLKINFVDPLVNSRSSPGFDARGVSLGLVIGFIIPVGGQLLFLAMCRVVFRFNYVVAAAFTLVSNPLNMIPLYYGYYCLGSVLLGKPISLDFRLFEKLMNPIMDKDYFWESLSAFMALGWEILVRWTVAAVVLAIVFGTAGYVATYAIQKKRCMNAAQKMGMKYEDFLAHLKRDAEEKT